MIPEAALTAALVILFRCRLLLRKGRKAQLVQSAGLPPVGTGYGRMLLHHHRWRGLGLRRHVSGQCRSDGRQDDPRPGHVHRCLDEQGLDHEGGERVREGEFYMLTVSTLLGMFMMMSAGHFLLFFLGLEMASVPLATMVAFDLHRNDSAEAAAKFILTATFSSGVMLFGISFLYGMCGTLYFDDVALQITRQAARRCCSWDWSSSSADWASRFLSCPSTSDRRHLPGCADHRHGLSERHLQGCGSLHAPLHPLPCLWHDDHVLAGTGDDRGGALHHHRQPLCHPTG